jgi:hypothetical protein
MYGMPLGPAGAVACNGLRMCTACAGAPLDAAAFVDAALEEKEEDEEEAERDADGGVSEAGSGKGNQDAESEGGSKEGKRASAGDDRVATWVESEGE